MRQDPDVILLGEIRNYNEIENAINLAETGHFVLATLHSKGVVHTADRLAASYPPASQDQARVQIASVLRGVIHQTLVPDRFNSRLPIVEIVTVDNIISTAILKKSVNFRDHIRSSDTWQPTKTPAVRFVPNFFVHAMTGKLRISVDI